VQVRAWVRVWVRARTRDRTRARAASVFAPTSLTCSRDHAVTAHCSHARRDHARGSAHGRDRASPARATPRAASAQEIHDDPRAARETPGVLPQVAHGAPKLRPRVAHGAPKLRAREVHGAGGQAPRRRWAAG